MRIVASTIKRIRAFASGISDGVSEDSAISCAKSCLDNEAGEIFLQHLIEKYEIDLPAGRLSVEEANYRNACNDVIKYIMVLAYTKPNN